MSDALYDIYNFRTESWEQTRLPLPDWRDYIPQNAPALALYDLYVEEMDMLPVDAAQKVLLACVRKEEENV